MLPSSDGHRAALSFVVSDGRITRIDTIRNLGEAAAPLNEAPLEFYPGLRSWLMRVNCLPEGGLEFDPELVVDLHDRPGASPRSALGRRRNGDLSMIRSAHLAGVPVEETIGALGPVQAVRFGALTAMLRGRWRCSK